MVELPPPLLWLDLANYMRMIVLHLRFRLALVPVAGKVGQASIESEEDARYRK